MTVPTVRKLAAIVSADVVGYSRLMREDEAATLAVLRRLRAELIGPTVVDHAGQIVKSMGDGWLFEFGSVSDAVAAALDIQQALTDDGPIRLRIGIHLGDIAHADDDIYGDGVNIAARLQEQAPPEAILISNDVLRQLDRRHAAVFLSVGEQVLKNIEQPVTTWVWPAALAVELRRRLALSQNRKPTVRVGDVVGRSAGDVELAAGLRDDLAAALSALSGIHYVVDADAADYMLAATVRTAGARVRVVAQLTEVSGKRQIWADRYELDADDPIELLDSCVYRISMATRTRIYIREGERLSGRELESLSVDDLLSYAAAKFFVPDAVAWLQIPPLMERVLAREPDNFMAMAMAAHATVGEFFYGYRRTDPREVALALARIDKAQRINGNVDFVHFARATLLTVFVEAPDEAVLAARRALELNPNYAYGFFSLGMAQVCAGDYGAATASMTLAIESDRRSPYLHLGHWFIGLAHIGAGDYAEAIAAYDRAQQLMPHVPATLMGLIVSHWLAGHHEEAHAWVRRLLEKVPPIRVADIHLPPYRDAPVRERYADALREAGVPE